MQGYDAASNVTSTTTTLPAYGSTLAGTEQQSFCYDELNRLVWSGTKGTPTGPATGSCGPTPQTDTLSDGSYSSTFSYDTLDRYVKGPTGTYTYGDTAHLHAATSTTSGYSLAYDAAGNLTCRAQNTSATCAGGTPTGQPLAYDNEGRLLHWQDTPTSPANTDSMAYDGEGNRVALTVVSPTSTKTTVFVGTLADYTTKGTSTSHINHYGFAGQLVAVRDSALHYLLTDTLGTPEVQVNGTTGAIENRSLKKPYGDTRDGAYSLFTYGFTGQRFDDGSTLSYYGARYYDRHLGQFTSADTVSDGLNRYAYVGDSPETLSDPTGNMAAPGGTTVSSDVPQAFYDAFNGDPPFDLAVGAEGAAILGTLAFMAVPVALLAGSAAILYSINTSDPTAHGTGSSFPAPVPAPTPGPGPSAPVTYNGQPNDCGLFCWLVPGSVTAHGYVRQTPPPPPPPTPRNQGAANGSGSSTLNSPNYVVTPGGDVIPVPEGARGPTLARSSNGDMYRGGSGGSGLDPRVNSVRIMDPTSRYPTGYVVYSNSGNQAVDPRSGKTVSRNDAHIKLANWFVREPDLWIVAGEP